MTLSVRLFRTDRACLLLVLATGLVLCATGLARRDLWDPDEPRTALATSAIVATGDWSVLRQDGRPWLEKPPLYYWLAAATSIAAGEVNELTVRLPANAAAVLCSVAVFFLGRELWGRRAGALAAIVLLTTEDFVVESRWARPDMLLALLMTLAALSAWCALRASFRTGWLAAFWIALGLAVLAKGPVGLLPLLALGVHLAATRGLGALRRLGAEWGVPVAALPTVLWILAWGRQTESVFPIGDALLRFGARVAGGIHHPHPPLHLLTTLPLSLLPWVVMVPAAVYETFPRRGRPLDERSVFLYSFLIVYVVMFAMSVEKRGIYLLPILPFGALLVGRLWDLSLFDWDPPPAGRAIHLGLFAWLVAVSAASAYYLPRIAEGDPDLLGPARLLASCAFIGALLPIIFYRRLAPGGAIALFALGAAAGLLVVTCDVMPAINQHKSARAFAGRVAALAGTREVGIHPDAHAGLSWYARRPLTILPDGASLAGFLARPDAPLAVVEEEAWRQLGRDGPETGRVVERGRVGHRAFVLVEAGKGKDEVPP
ncbi:MAG TPA: glycosyltransferase family 39 protein [Patescibacteria group bacterium]|nr:glycosyltransferase family 39 protein [Patescibacteria group bacterium]